MAYLYLTADQIGITSGGGRVTQEESTALFDLSVELGKEFPCCLSRDELESDGPDPWKWDLRAEAIVNEWLFCGERIELVHVYAGTFSRTLDVLKRHGAKVSYTAAAHNVYLSAKAHRDLGLDFPYPHLTDPQLWQRYLAGYLAADVVICPSQHSAECMRSYGCQNIEIIPHGVDAVADELIKPASNRFVVGYLGAYGPDKGVRYLLEAWKKLNYRDGSVLVLAGRDSTSPFVQNLVGYFSGDHFQLVMREEDLVKKAVSQLGVVPGNGGQVYLRGWVENVADFYNDISLYVQPSVAEGFGIEILEALSHGRAVLCSTGAGAADVVPETWRFPAEDVDALAEKIDQFRQADLRLMGSVGRGLAKEYEWSIIREKYQRVWKELLAE